MAASRVILYELGLDPVVHWGPQWGSEQGGDVISLALEEPAQQVATHRLPPLSPGSTREPANPSGGFWPCSKSL